MFLNVKISKATPERALQYAINKNVLEYTKKRNLFTDKSPAQEMRETAARYGKWQNQKDRKTFSLVVSPNPQDNPSQEQLLEMTEAILDHFFPSIQGIIVLHFDKGKDAEKSNPVLHAHFYGSIVDPATGKNIHLSDSDIRQIRKWADAYASCRFGWKPFKRTTNKSRSYKREMKQRIQNRGQSGWIDTLALAVNEAYEKAKSFDEFCSILSNKGIAILQEEQTHALKFEITVKGKRYQVNSKTLGAHLTWDKLQEKFIETNRRNNDEYTRPKRTTETQEKLGKNYAGSANCRSSGAGQDCGTGHSIQRKINYACILCTRDKDICKRCSEYKRKGEIIGHGFRSL